GDLRNRRRRLRLCDQQRARDPPLTGTRPDRPHAPRGRTYRAPMADASLPRRDLLKGLACTPLALAARGIGRRALPRVDEIAREFATLDRAAAFARLAELRRLGLSPREALGAVLLAGITEIRPRPVGFKLHAV